MPDLEKLRKQIAAGEYQLDAASIAGALLDYACIGEASTPGDLERAAAEITAEDTRSAPVRRR